MDATTSFDYPLPVGNPLSPHSQLAHSHRTSYVHCPARPTRPNVVLAGAHTFASGRAVSRSGSFQGQLQHSLSFMTSVCLPVMSWMGGFREAVRRLSQWRPVL